MDSQESAKPIDREARILILGAGPGGLSAAYFLRKHGYRNVTVFEQLGRVGGLCRTVTDRQQAFEIGATFVGPDFREVLRLARETGAKLEKFDGAAGFTFDEAAQTAGYRNLAEYVVGGTSLSDYFRFFRRCCRYAWKRFRLNHVFRPGGWNGLAARSDLQQSFLQWLRNHRLEDMSHVFEIPITAFGYGSLDEIPAPYALRYMSVRAFLASLLTVVPGGRRLPGCLTVRCFQHGYQRFWEQVAWDLDVRLNVEVRRIERRADGVQIVYSHPAHLIGAESPEAGERASYDYLILACPLTAHELQERIDFDGDERSLLSRIRVIRYAVVGLEVEGLTPPKPILIHVPTPPFGRPMILWHPHPDGKLVTCYTRLPDGEPHADEEARYRRSVEQCIAALGGRISSHDGRHFYDVVSYFRHVDGRDFAEGIFDRWDRRQGTHRTFYTGGLFDFDYVEGTVRAGRRLVERFFAKVT